MCSTPFRRRLGRRRNGTSNWREHDSRRFEMVHVTKDKVFQDLGFSREEAAVLAMRLI
jgi:hypothetical protein